MHPTVGGNWVTHRVYLHTKLHTAHDVSTANGEMLGVWKYLIGAGFRALARRLQGRNTLILSLVRLPIPPLSH